MNNTKYKKMPKKKEESGENKTEYMKIVYKDANDRIQTAIIRLPEDVCLIKSNYKDRVDTAITDIVDSGGFWLNDTDAIPVHRIMSFHTHKGDMPKVIPNGNPKRGRSRRGKRKSNANPVSGGNSVPQPASESDKQN